MDRANYYRDRSTGNSLSHLNTNRGALSVRSSTEIPLNSKNPHSHQRNEGISPQPHNLTPIHHTTISALPLDLAVRPNEIQYPSGSQKANVLPSLSTSSMGLPHEPQPPSYSSSISSSSSPSPNMGRLVFEKLRLKLRETEIENDNLRNLLREKEDSMNRLVSSLSQKPAHTVKEKRDNSTQTKKDFAMEKDLITQRKEIDSYEQKLLISLSERDQLSKRITDLNRDIAACQTTMACMRDQYSINENSYSQKIIQLESLVEELKSTNLSLSQKRKLSMEVVKSNISANTTKKLHDIQRQYALLRSEWNSLRNTMTLYESNMKALEQQNITSLKIFAQRLNHLNNHHMVELDEIKRQLAMELEAKNRLQSSIDEKNKVHILENEIDELKTILKIEKDLRRVSEEKISTNAHQFEEKLRFKDLMIGELQLEIKSHLGKNEKRGLVIRNAKQEVLSLQEKRQAEIQAVRHDAHVKDLSRVANIRELTLERDKVLLELQTAR